MTTRRLALAFAVAGFLAIRGRAQDYPPPGPRGGMQHNMHDPPDGRLPPFRGGPETGMGGTGRGGKWWNNPAMMRRLGLTAAQQDRIGHILQESRLHLIDLRAALDKQELLLTPLLAVDHPKESSVLPQIDRIATARAQLEKANARMLFEIRLVLTLEQWRDLQEDRTPPHHL